MIERNKVVPWEKRKREKSMERGAGRKSGAGGERGRRRKGEKMNCLAHF